MMKPFVRFDWAIKKLLRSKANFEILEGFLSELLTPGKDIKILRFLESESNKGTHDDKSNRVDMLAELTTGELVLIEVQVNHEIDFLQRILYGASKVVTEYLGSGESYSKIKKVYSVNILYFDLGQGKDYIYRGVTNFKGVHDNDTLELNDKQKELYKKQYVGEIYPEYYLIKVNNFDDLAKNTLDEWIYFLKNEDIRDDFRAKGLAKAKENLTIMKLPKPEQAAYNRYLEDIHYEASIIGGSYDEGRIEGEKVGIEKGEKIGIDKGKKIGIEEGEKIGIEKGEKLGLEKGMREVAKRMKQTGSSPEFIKQVTGLVLSEIEKI